MQQQYRGNRHRRFMSMYCIPTALLVPAFRLRFGREMRSLYAIAVLQEVFRTDDLAVHLGDARRKGMPLIPSTNEHVVYVYNS